MLNIPILRQGNPYYSLDISRVPHHQSREIFVEVSQANAGLIRRDLGRQEIATASLSASQHVNSSTSVLAQAITSPTIRYLSATRHKLRKIT